MPLTAFWNIRSYTETKTNIEFPHTNDDDNVWGARNHNYDNIPDHISNCQPIWPSIRTLRFSLSYGAISLLSGRIMSAWLHGQTPKQNLSFYDVSTEHWYILSPFIFITTLMPLFPSHVNTRCENTNFVFWRKIGKKLRWCDCLSDVTLASIKSASVWEKVVRVLSLHVRGEVWPRRSACAQKYIISGTGACDVY
jgi:hypothetical protein